MDAFTKAIKEARKGISYKTHYMLLRITDQLYERMKEKGLNFSQIAQKLNVSRARISALFSCQHNITLKTLIAVADALDCELKVEIVPKEIVLRREQFYYHSRELYRSTRDSVPQNFDITVEDDEYAYASAA